jgi:hypothetical protein
MDRAPCEYCGSKADMYILIDVEPIECYDIKDDNDYAYEYSHRVSLCYECYDYYWY